MELRYQISTEKLSNLKVYVYYNIRKQTFSVKALEGEFKGLVILHSDYVSLIDCEFRVSEKGRQKVLETKQKNIHAAIVGRLTDDYTGAITHSCKVTYNPYKYENFVDCMTHDAIHEADHTLLYMVDKAPQIMAFFT